MFPRAMVLMVLLLPLPAVAQDMSSSSSSSVAPPPVLSLSDPDLELAVRAAYNGAAAFAAAHGNYFARDGVVAPLHAAIAEALAATYPSVAVPDATIDGVPSKACLTAPGTALRVSSNVFGDGLWLTAVSGTRLFGYAYDPHKSGEIVVQPATACGR